jgi:hypothetical protein
MGNERVGITPALVVFRVPVGTAPDKTGGANRMASEKRMKRN